MKKLFTLLGLIMMMLVVANTSSYGQTSKYVLNGKPGVSTPEGYFSYDTNGKWNFNTKFNGCTYDGTTFTQGLKMEGSTKILFTNANVANVTIVQATSDASTSNKTIKFDGSELNISDAATITNGRVYTISNVAAGDHEITRGSGESGLFQVTVEEIASQDEPPIITTQPQDVEYILSTTDYPSVSIVATDDTSNPTTYQWQYSQNGNDFFDIPAIIAASAITATLNGSEAIPLLGNVKAGDVYYLRCIASNTNGSTTSEAATLSIKNPYVATPVITPGSKTFTESVTVTATTETEGATLMYAFEEGANEWTEFPTEGDLVITETKTIYVKGVKANYAESEIVSATYTKFDKSNLEPISGDAEWTFTTSNTIELTDNTFPAKYDEDFYTYSDIATLFNVTVPEGFSSTTLEFRGQYPFRGSYASQNGEYRFNTNNPGTVTVEFSNTGSSNNGRWVKVNETTGTVEAVGTEHFTESFEVEAGDVLITHVNDQGAMSPGIRIFKITFVASDGKQASDLAIVLPTSSVDVSTQEPANVQYTTSSTGAVSAVSSNDDVATVTVDQNNQTITITGVKPGQTSVTVSQEADDDYTAGSKQITVVVYNPNAVYVYEAQGANDEFILTKGSFGGEFGGNADNEFATTTTGDWKDESTYGEYTGEFYNLSKPARSMSFTVHGAENFKLLVQNTNAGRHYTVQVGNEAAVTVTHNGNKLEYSPVFQSEYTQDVPITITGDDGSVYPVAIIFNTADIDPVTLNEFGYATFSSQYDAIIDDNTTTANTITVGGSADAAGCYPIYVESIGQIIPAEKGVFLVGEPNAKVTFSYATPDDVMEVPTTNNILLPTTTANGLVPVPATAPAVVLFGNEFCVYTGAEFLPNKAYFDYIDMGNGQQSFKLVFDKKDATAINGVEAEAEAAAPAKVIKNGQLFIGNFNIAGQQVK